MRSTGGDLEQETLRRQTSGCLVCGGHAVRDAVLRVRLAGLMTSQHATRVCVTDKRHDADHDELHVCRGAGTHLSGHMTEVMAAVSRKSCSAS